MVWLVINPKTLYNLIIAIIFTYLATIVKNTFLVGNEVFGTPVSDHKTL